ncbi:MAG: ester cyclase [Burkholderiales bacterium]
MTNQDRNNSNSPLVGFDPEFRDLDHYIRVITERIWEGRRIDDIHKYYSDPCVVETPASVTTTVADVVDGTKRTLAQFPDRRLLAEDIIQSGDAVGGFLSSHRIISTMTHLGEGDFGAATGKRIHVRTIADCVCKQNRIIHEWLVRDQSAIALQIGVSPQTLAQRWLDTKPGWSKPRIPDSPAGYRSALTDDPVACAYASALTQFATQKLTPDGMARTYDDAVHQLGPGGVTRYGHAEVGHYWQTLFAIFAPRQFDIEHLAVNRGDGRADRIAVRWRAQTRHIGQPTSQFGRASGNAVEIMGINHVECWRGRVLREWVLIDEIALWMQVLGGRPENHP